MKDGGVTACPERGAKFRRPKRVERGALPSVGVRGLRNFTCKSGTFLALASFV